MRRIKLLLALLALALVLPSLSGHGQDPDEKKVSALMRKKLEHSQKILEGITTNDPRLIARHADELIAISKEAEWMVLRTPQYEVRSNEFRRTAEELIKNAEDRNLDAAALSYVEMTLTCVKCHKYVREVRKVELDVRPGLRAAAP
jgi:hypothetical protein